MSGSRWKPLPPSLPEPARELAERLRELLDRSGLSLRRLAADDEVHYSVTALHRFFAGQALPPSQLIDVLARRSGADAGELHRLHDRARTAVGDAGAYAAGTGDGASSDLGDVAGPPDAGRRRQWWLRVLPRRRTAALALFAAGLVTGLVASQLAGQLAPNEPPLPDAPVGSQLLHNGSFTDTEEPWWRSAPDIGLARQDGRLRASVPGRTAKPWDRVVGQSGFALTKDRRYTLQFEIAACNRRHVGVAVQLENEPFDKTLEQGIEVDATMRRFTIDFTSTITVSSGALNFMLGGHPHDCWFLIDNVSLVEWPNGHAALPR